MADFTEIESIARELSQIDSLLAQRREMRKTIREIGEKVLGLQNQRTAVQSDLERLEQRIEGLISKLGLSAQGAGSGST